MKARLPYLTRPVIMLFLAATGSIFSPLYAVTTILSRPSRPTTFPLSRPTTLGSVVGWGNNMRGQTTVPADLGAVVAIAAGGHSAALRSDGTVVAWGVNYRRQTNVPPQLNSVVGVSVGEEHTVALKADGTVVAWGSNAGGAVTGTPTTNSPYAAIANPVSLGGKTLTGVVSIAAGYYHTLALTKDGTVVAWPVTSITMPPIGLFGVVAIAAGSRHSVALKDDGTVVVWGGEQVMNTPIGLTGVVAIAAGRDHTLALRSDGTVVAWGLNSTGQLNVPPAALSGLVAIAAGGTHSIGLKADSNLVFWGNNYAGQSTVPPGLTDVFAVAGGYEHTLALRRSHDMPSPAIASAIAEVVNGFVVAFTVTERGFGYISAPSVNIVGGNGAGAMAEAVVSGGSVTAIRVINPGSGYTAAPAVVIGPPFLPPRPSAAIHVRRVSVEMNLTIGFKYQVEGSADLKAWVPIGPPFIAGESILTQEYDLTEPGYDFRVRQLQ